MFLSFKIIVYVCWLLSYNYFVFMGSMSTASHQVLVFPPFGFFFYLFELVIFVLFHYRCLHTGGLYKYIFFGISLN